mgnify:FL=1
MGRVSRVKRLYRVSRVKRLYRVFRVKRLYRVCRVKRLYRVFRGKRLYRVSRVKRLYRVFRVKRLYRVFRADVCFSLCVFLRVFVIVSETFSHTLIGMWVQWYISISIKLLSGLNMYQQYK